MYFTTRQAENITGVTLRQLQYWREQRLIVPTVDATGRGRSVFYTRADLVSLMVMAHLLARGLDYSQACAGLQSLSELEPNYQQPTTTNRYLLTIDQKVIIKPFNVDEIQHCMELGLPVIPIWLDQIHLQLTQRLNDQTGWESRNMKQSSEADTRRALIDKALSLVGWVIVPYQQGQDSRTLTHHAVTEYPIATGRADYALFVNGLLMGIIEAKKLSLGSQAALEQAKRYASGAFDGVGNWRGYRVPFLYSTNGELIYYLDVRHESNLSREIKGFHSPAALSEFLKHDQTKGYQWLESTPIEENRKLRSYQLQALEAIENAIKKGKRELLVAMATGTGKTFTMVSSIYRLLASKTVKRVLFLVDRTVLARQAVSAFGSFQTPNGNKFDQEYEVYSQSFQKESGGNQSPFNTKILPNSYLTNPAENHTFVYVCTIQRMKNNLFGAGSYGKNNGDWEDETEAEPLDIPIHGFDLIVADECHRGYTASEESAWRAVLEHFDAIKIGLTATPAKHTIFLFKELVYRYSTEKAIADGYLVDYEQININSQVKINGTFLREGEIVSAIDTDTGARFYEQLEDEREFNSSDIERRITVPDSNRKIIQELARYAHQHEEETGRFPKILIFATNDLSHTSHADTLVTICKEVFARGDDFVQKITGKVDDPLEKIKKFRNRPQPAIVVTVDLLTTGVDIPALEFVVFMRPVKSRILWVQMLGRGTRLCEDINKTHFKIFDCFGGSLVEYFADSTDFKLDPPRQQAMSMGQVIDNLLNKIDTEHHLNILTRRFHRIDRSITPEGKEVLEGFLPESSVKGLANSFRETMATSPNQGLVLLENSDFVEFLENYPRVKATFLVAEEVEDTVSSEVVIEGQKPAAYLDAFYRFITEHNQEIEALQILRQSPQKWNAEALEELRSKLVQNSFSESNLQKAYQLVHHKALADLISLIRSAFDHSYPVSTAQERVEKAIATVTEGKDFTPEQLQWLGYISGHLIHNLSINSEDFESAPIFERHGGRGKANKVFQGQLPKLIQDLNMAIAA